MRFLSLIFHFAFILFSLFIFVYILPISPTFPNHLPDSVQSLELADTETPLRRGYYTNYSREQVVEFYKSQFGYLYILGFEIPSIRLNYPPEDSFILIRDQTKSTYLEEIVHPFRESVFINGFIPMMDKDDIWYKGVHYTNKITVRYESSNVFIRVFFAIVSLICTYFILLFTGKEFKRFILAIKTLLILK